MPEKDSLAVARTVEALRAKLRRWRSPYHLDRSPELPSVDHTDASYSRAAAPVARPNRWGFLRLFQKQ